VIGREGVKIGSAFVSKDVTELTDAIRLREDFLAGVSHELRTPLTSIVGYLEVIEDSIDAKAIGIDRELGIIQRNSNQLMMRIGDLLNVTDQTISLNPRSIDIPPVVQQAVDAIRFRADSAGITLELSLCESFEASVDPGRFAQVLDNLLTNAVKYTPRNGTIRVDLRTDAAAFTFVVADSGTGIPATELPLIFDRFYRSESVRGGSISGAGLGLAIVQNIVRAHKATIGVESELGIGTTFTVTVPRGA
jgi:signal transduction histidine kinase